MNKKIIIAIDGYSSTGKSTLARMLAKHFLYKHINTGSMYRALTLHALRNGWIRNFDHIEQSKIIRSIDELKIDFRCDDKHGCVIYLNDENIETEIKKEDVSKYVSHISAYPLVRKKIIEIQQEIGSSRGVVMEGRDIGSVVFPSAEIKLFITASVSVRAGRRHKELVSLGIKSSLKSVLNNLKTRDHLDSNRKNSPLICVEDAILIDNTCLNIDDQFQLVTDLIKKKYTFS